MTMHNRKSFTLNNFIDVFVDIQRSFLVPITTDTIASPINKKLSKIHFLDISTDNSYERCFFDTI